MEQIPEVDYHLKKKQVFEHCIVYWSTAIQLTDAYRTIDINKLI